MRRIWTSIICLSSNRPDDGLLPQTRRARSEGAGVRWLGWRWSKSDWAYRGTLALRGLTDVRGDRRCAIQRARGLSRQRDEGSAGRAWRRLSGRDRGWQGEVRRSSQGEYSLGLFRSQRHVVALVHAA